MPKKVKEQKLSIKKTKKLIALIQTFQEEARALLLPYENSGAQSVLQVVQQFPYAVVSATEAPFRRDHAKAVSDLILSLGVVEGAISMTDPKIVRTNYSRAHDALRQAIGKRNCLRRIDIGSFKEGLGLR